MTDAPLDFTLNTARLTLRQMTPDDAPDFRRMVCLPSVGRMLFVFPPDWTVEAARAWIPDWIYRGALKLRLAIEDPSGRFIGTVGAVDMDGRVQLFYFIDPDHAGHGYVSEAARAFLTWLFARFDIDMVHADAFIDNPASARVLEKLGFEYMGQGMGSSAARLEDCAISLYRLTRNRFESTLS